MPENPENFSFYVPDTFAAGSECFPKKLESFQKFNLAMARDNSRVVNSKNTRKRSNKFFDEPPGYGYEI
jgi:hypothetical protein